MELTQTPNKFGWKRDPFLPCQRRPFGVDGVEKPCANKINLDCLLMEVAGAPPLALAVPLSRFTSRVGGGSAFYVRGLRTSLKTKFAAWLIV
jgi:hypothetical protein